MRAVVLRRAGEPAALRLESVADPVAGEGEVVVRLRAAALNHRDVFICRGQYAGLHFPTILGADGVGEVVALGSGVGSFHVDDPVIINPCLDWGDNQRIAGPAFRILGMPDDGTFAEFVRLPAANVFPRPAGLTAETAAALPLAGLTAYRALVSRGAVQHGECALITGVGGGVATLALLMARALGARVFVTSGSDEKLRRAKELGAEGGANYRTQDWVAEVRQATAGGPDLIIDSVGGTTLDQALDVVRPGGRVVTYGATAGNTPQLTVRRIFWKQVSVLGTTMGSPADFSGMVRLVADHAVQPVIDRVYPLAEAGAALEWLERGEQFGKIVLRID
ncbi:MAG TPA: zinc-binding dehydrogenase [Chloroflexota bacterium]|jgi:NADPH:quinone reductase-like Zn-dependent oxidoreductase